MTTHIARPGSKAPWLALVAWVAGACDASSDTSAAAAPSGAATATAAEPSAAVDASAALEALGKDALFEKHDAGSIGWNIASNGEVRALVRGATGEVKTGVSGSLAWKGEGRAVKTVALAQDKKTGLLVATGPKLDADLTQIDYTLAVDGKPWSGTLHLSPGGTAALVASARASAEAGLAGKIGPHGGVVALVGADRFEIVVDEGSGEARVYLLDARLELLAIGDRKVSLGVMADAPELVVLVPEPEAQLYAAGKLDMKIDPVRVTLAVRHGASVSVAVVGLGADATLAAGAKAPRIAIRVKGDAFADIDAKAKAKLDLEVKAPDVDVKVKVKKPKAGATAKAGAGARGAKAKAGASVKIGF